MSIHQTATRWQAPPTTPWLPRIDWTDLAGTAALVVRFTVALRRARTTTMTTTGESR